MVRGTGIPEHRGHCRAAGPGIEAGDGAVLAVVLIPWGLVPGHWGRQLCIGVGELPTPMGGFLPRRRTGCTRACRAAYPNGRSPAPIGRCPPRCVPLRYSTSTSLLLRDPSALSRVAFALRAPNCGATGVFRAGWVHSGQYVSLTRPPQGAVVVQNASGFRCFRRAQHGGGPKCVSVRRIWPDSGEFGQTQTHFGPRTRKDPGSARDSDAFRTTGPFAVPPVGAQFFERPAVVGARGAHEGRSPASSSPSNRTVPCGTAPRRRTPPPGP